MRHPRTAAPRCMRIAKPRGRLSAALHRLEEALARDPGSLGRSAREFMQRYAFHDYSPLNRALVWGQCPAASFVMGRARWAACGRTVKPGARAIFLLAPDLKRGDGGRTRWFKTVRVYDVSDTTGEAWTPPLSDTPPLGEERLVERLRGQLRDWIRGSGLRLETAAVVLNLPIDGATDGRTIWIRPGLSPAEEVAVLAHEIAHVLLHVRPRDRGKVMFGDQPGQRSSRDVMELQAELTAFLLLEFSGIDSSQASARYLNSWQATKSSVRAHAQRCMLAACRVMRACERRSYTRYGDATGLLSQARSLSA